ncbi:MAG TPA: Ig-like domain-containing protein, partial [Pseudoxanthomonas sp.]|nr:Ig-like domain-containing protein [Pseudoxanthomonas sp.]
MNAAKNGIDHKGVGNAMNTPRHAWKSVASGLLLGLLLAGSASTHIERASAASTTSTASPKAPGVYGAADQRLRLSDDRRLDLSADGTTLALWDKDLRRVIRTQTIPDPRIDATMTLLPSGRVLIWGGASKSGLLQPDGLWFDPQLNAVDAARGLPMAARAGHTATVLTDGRVLFAGGRSATGKAQIWSEAGNRLVEVESALAARVDHRAQLQADGRVRIYGGHSANAPVNGDLVFDPVANAFAQAGPGKDAAAVPAPGLAASLPAQAAKDVAPDQPLSIRFTEPVRMPELNPSNVLLLGPGGAAHVRITAAEDGRLAFVMPRQALFPDSAYTLMVDGVHTRSGRKLPLMAIDFKTAALPAEAGE